MESEEAAFQAILDANPDDHLTRLVLADWLQERGDRRAEGYRALGTLRLRPKPYAFGEYEGSTFAWFVTSLDPEREDPASDLPPDWFDQIMGGNRDQYYQEGVDFADRKQAEDAAAFAFLKLPPERRRELIETPPST